MNKDKNEIEELIELKNKLTNGMVFKSYRALCENMKWKPTGGDTKVANMKRLDAICTYHKQGNSIVIDEVFDAPLLIEDNRKGKQPSNFPQFKVDEDKFHNAGIYMIKLDNQVYIGSTTSFRRRFREHFYGANGYVYTKELLDNGGTFSILHDMTGIEDEELLRMVEQEYIMFYDLETDYEVINRKMVIKQKSEFKKVKYKTLRVEEKYYDEILEFYNKLTKGDVG